LCPYYFVPREREAAGALGGVLATILSGG